MPCSFLFCVFVSYTEIDVTAYMLTEKVIAKYLIVCGMEPFVIADGMVCTDTETDRALAAWLGKQTNGRIAQTGDVDASTEADVDRRCLARGNHTVLLLDEDTAFAHLTAAEAVYGASVLHLCLHTDKNGSTKREAEGCICCGV